MEKETYKTAKELLEKYDPDSDIISVSIISVIVNIRADFI
jgi:hypothetical protein